MKKVEEGKAWQKISGRGTTLDQRSYLIFGRDLVLDDPCLVVGGRNGAGKSRLLAELESKVVDEVILIDLHRLCELILTVLRSRDDLAAMSNEFDPFGPDQDRLDDLRRVIGRDYDAVRWYALDVEPHDAATADQMTWAGGSPLLPYFEAEFKGKQYSSCEMGLGEFAVHLLFWILEQHREIAPLLVLLDEPDAFLPPVGIQALLDRLLHISVKRQWQIVLTTHSEEMLARAMNEDAFLFLRTDGSGNGSWIRSRDQADAGFGLLSRPPVDRVLFCEDEAAKHLTAALMEAHDRRLLHSTAILWGNGYAYLEKLQHHLPQHSRSPIRFALVFDGDRRDHVVQLPNRWPALLLPSRLDPADLLRQAAVDQPGRLAAELSVEEGQVLDAIDALQGRDAHDWVDGFGERFGRQVALTGLCRSWVGQNPDEVPPFMTQLLSLSS